MRNTISQIFISIVFLLSFVQLSGQHSILYANGESAEGLITHDSNLSPYSTINFSASTAIEPTIYSPEELSGYTDSEFGEFISTNYHPVLANYFPNEAKFLKIILTGEIAVYKLEFKELGGNIQGAAPKTIRSYIVVENDKAFFIGSAREMRDLRRNSQCVHASIAYAFTDFEVGSYFKEIAECRGLNSQLMVEGAYLDKRIYFHVEGGYVRNNWSSKVLVFRSTDFFAGDRAFFSIKAAKAISEKLELHGGLFYTSYTNNGESFEIVNCSCVGNGEILGGPHEINASFLGGAFGLNYYFTDNQNTLSPYLSGGVQYGLSLDYDYLVNEIYTRTISTGTSEFILINDRELTRGNSSSLNSSLDGESILGISLGAGTLISISEEINGFIEIRAMINSTIPDQAYIYKEIGLVGGIRF